MTKFDHLNSAECPRCGGSGRHSFNMRDGDMCWGCQGTGLVLVTPKGQPKIEPDAEWAWAGVGEVTEYNLALVVVEEVVWKNYGIYAGYNQRVTIRRLVDGKVSHIKRQALRHTGETMQEYKGKGVYVTFRHWRGLEASEAMYGQPATKDEDGEWVLF